MKAINLKGILNPMSDSEMKNVKGGILDFMIPPADGGGVVDDATNYCEHYTSCTKSSDCPGDKLCTHYGGISGSCCR